MLTKSRTVKKKDIFEDGTERAYLSNVVPLKNELGKIIGKAAITLDVTEQEQEIQDRIRALQERVDLCKVYAASIAHEMRTPLAAVDTMAHSLKATLPALLKAHEIVVSKNLMEDDSLSRAQISMLEELPNTLHEITVFANADVNMMLAQITHEEAEPELKILSMNETLAKTLSIYPFSGDEFDKVDFLTDMDFEFKGDIDFLRHILFNLIKNALYYIKASNKKDAKVDIWLEPGTKFNILRFKDTANGVDPEALTHIFEPFYTRRSGGTGIGLFLCKDFMHKMGGDISCESVKGEYTEFKLYFPVLKENQ